MSREFPMVQWLVVQSLSHVLLFATPWTAACQAVLSFTISWSLLELMSTELVMPSNHLILCRPLFPLPSVFPSIKVFSNESVFASGGQIIGTQLSISPSNEYSGLIFSRIDWFDLLAPSDSQEDSNSFPVVRTWCFNCHDPDSIPGWRSL